jgi:UPF0755 protein
MAAVALVLALGVPLAVTWRVLLAPATRVAPGQQVTVEIPPGATTTSIAAELAARGVIDNAAMFRLRARVFGIDDEFRPGTYVFVTGMGYADVERRLRQGPPLKVVRVTVPEGFTAEQIAQRFERDAGVPASEMTALAYGGAARFADEHPYVRDAYGGSLEGYLFPKTYEVERGVEATAVIEMMLDQFDREIARVDLSSASARGMTLADVVTIASIVEREARLPAERPLVASVVYNRLEKGMRLEIDATVEYVIKQNRPRLRAEDLRIESPYNTYRVFGLPPGPIANPGLASLQAAAEPADTEYLYYVLTGTDGSHTFVRTYEEFLAAKEKSREVVP